MSDEIVFCPVRVPEPGETVTMELRHLLGVVETRSVVLPESGWEPRLLIGGKEYVWLTASVRAPTVFRFWAVEELERLGREAELRSS